MAAYLCPIGAGDQFFDNSGNVLAGGLLYTYYSNSDIAQATWTTPTQSVQNANPIVLDSAGRPTQEVWLAGGINNYRVVLKSSAGTTLGDWDNVTGISSSNAVQSEWVTSGLTVTYVSATQFSVSGNQTAVFHANRRIQYILGTGTYYGYVTSSSVAAGVTTVVVTPASTNLNGTLTAVNYAFNSSTNPSVPQNYVKQGDAINNSSIGVTNPAAGKFTTMVCPSVTITGGTITGITGFSVPDFLLINSGVI